MGTSADRTPGSGGAWTPLKYATASYVRGLGSGDVRQRDRALRVLARHVPVLGGAGAAAGSASAGRAGMQRLGGLLAGMGGPGLAPTLEALGLAELVGRDRFDVLDGLVTLLAGDGDDLDSQAARDAACDVLDEVFADADTWQDLAAATVTRDDMQAMLEMFLARYIYNRMPVIAERLGRLADQQAARQADADMRQLITDLVALRLPEDPFTIDWAGSQGRQIADDTIGAVYETLEALDGSDE
ncbi:hypothetical protein ACN26Z_04885 [Verrucosispora sp. WMMD703]|uniref:hypothetical protein n=1 Tax=Verrucosispora sp. WMMD703 TaxID=3403463 RepID=UPI003B92F086